MYYRAGWSYMTDKGVSDSDKENEEIRWRNYKLKRPPAPIYRIKGIGASTVKDLHGEQLSVNDLERLARGLEKDPFLYLGHDLSKPPSGKGVSWNIRNEGGINNLEIEYEIWDENMYKQIQEGKVRGLSAGWVESDEWKD